MGPPHTHGFRDGKVPQKVPSAPGPPPARALPGASWCLPCRPAASGRPHAHPRSQAAVTEARGPLAAPRGAQASEGGGQVRAGGRWLSCA